MHVFCRPVALPDPLVSLQHNLTFPYFTLLNWGGGERYLSQNSELATG
jgi:hypothetical protein